MYRPGEQDGGQDNGWGHSVSQFLVFMLFCHLLFFFQKIKEINSGTLSLCQTFWIQIMTDSLSVMILVQTGCKGCQWMTKVTVSTEEIKNFQFI